MGLTDVLRRLTIPHLSVNLSRIHQTRRRPLIFTSSLRILATVAIVAIMLSASAAPTARYYPTCWDLNPVINGCCTERPELNDPVLCDIQSCLPWYAQGGNPPVSKPQVSASGWAFGDLPSTWVWCHMKPALCNKTVEPWFCDLGEQEDFHCTTYSQPTIERLCPLVEDP
jgi:hypothetical protein